MKESLLLVAAMCNKVGPLASHGGSVDWDSLSGGQFDHVFHEPGKYSIPLTQEFFLEVILRKHSEMKTVIYVQGYSSQHYL